MKKLFALLLAITSISASAQWINLFDDTYTSPEYNKRIDENRIQIWIKMNYPNGESMVTLEQYNCADRTGRIISIQMYNSTGTADPFRNWYNGEHYQINRWKDIEPGSYFSKKFKTSCNGMK